jgi:hypothetical protein
MSEEHEGNLWKGICWALFITGLAIGIVVGLIMIFNPK